MPGQGGPGFGTDLEPAQLRTAVESALAQSRDEAEGMIWGPQRSFRFGALRDDAPREGGPMAWTLRALIAFYYIEHDNQPATAEEVTAWVSELTPAQVVTAVNVGVVVGLP